jgi:hypothetical protein
VELPWALAPPDGRYVVRGHAGEPTHVLVVGSLAAERAGRRARRRGRAREVEPEPAPPAVPVTRVTLVAAEPFGDPREADHWLRGADGDAEAQEALAVLGRVLHALRVASADPSIGTPSRAQALVVRLGLGEGEQVAEGRWTRAVELPGGPPTRRRAGRGRAAGDARAGDRLAALLGGRDAALACEELALRARSDVDADRHREAALQLRAALEAGLAELQPWSDRGDLADRLAELAAARATVDEAATAALAGGLDDAQITGVGHVLSRLEAALRARTAAGSD